MTIGEEGVGVLHGAPTLVVFECADCGWTGEFDNRFTRWCEGCGFNAESTPPAPDKRWIARRKARNRARAQELCDQLATARDLKPTSATGIAVTIASTLVHLVTVGLVIASVLVIKTWAAKYWWAWAAAGSASSPRSSCGRSSGDCCASRRVWTRRL